MRQLVGDRQLFYAARREMLVLPALVDGIVLQLQAVTQQELLRTHHPAAAAIDLQKHASLT